MSTETRKGLSLAGLGERALIVILCSTLTSIGTVQYLKSAIEEMKVEFKEFRSKTEERLASVEQSQATAKQSNAQQDVAIAELRSALQHIQETTSETRRDVAVLVERTRTQRP